MVQNETSSQKIKRAPVHEGMKNHYITFALSIVLTALAFFAVMNPNIPSGFVYFFIVILAAIQAVAQLLFWMHMKDRGHVYAQMAFIVAALVLLPIFITALFWIWW
jgi:cytochrome c oxidase subunit 4